MGHTDAKTASSKKPSGNPAPGTPSASPVLILLLGLVFFIAALYCKEQETDRLLSKVPADAALVSDQSAALLSSVPVMSAEPVVEQTLPPRPPAPKRPKMMQAKGFLRLDRDTGKHTITLGLAHGAENGDILLVLDDDKVVGKVRVVNAMEDICFVELYETDTRTLSGDYYDVSFSPETPAATPSPE